MKGEKPLYGLHKIAKDNGVETMDNVLTFATSVSINADAQALLEMTTRRGVTNPKNKTDDQ